MCESSQTGTLSMEIDEDGSVNLSGLCRLCASRCSPGDIEDPLLKLKTDSLLAMKLRLFFSIKIPDDHPRLPRQICSKCCSTIKNWEALLDTVKRSESFYSRQLELSPLEIKDYMSDESTQETLTSNDEEEFECSTCHGRFTNKSDLLQHIKLHQETKVEFVDEAENIEITPIIDISPDNSPDQSSGSGLRKKHKFSSEITVTTTKSSSTKVERNLLKSPQPPKIKKAYRKQTPKRPDLSAKDYPCGKCELRFDEFVDFAKHIQSHNSSRELPCGICGCNFKKIPYLLNHVIDHKQNPESVQTFPCKLCNTVYNSKKNLGSHLAYRHKARPKRKVTPRKIDPEPEIILPILGSDDFVCGTCRLVYSGIAAFTLHFAQKHPVFYELSCGVCDIKFKKLPTLLKHEQLHKLYPILKCKYCPQKFKDKIDLIMHTQSEHKLNIEMEQTLNNSTQVQEYFENVQPSTSTAVPNLGEPIPGLTSYTCGACDETFTQIIDFANHFPKTHQMFDTLPCGVCFEGFEEVQALISHEQNHRLNQEYECNECPMNFETGPHFLEHYRIFHKPSPLPSPKKETTTATKIKETPKKEKSTTKKEIKIRKQTVTPSKDRVITRRKTPIDPELTPEGKYKCPHCECLDFESIHEYSKHCLTHEPNKCPCCQDIFKSKKSLQRHLRDQHLKNKPKETQDKKFPCPICNRFFKTKQNVTIHLELHSNERNYVCDICAKSFRNLSNMYKHQQIHFDMPKFTCDFCQRQIKHKSAIRKHIMLHIQYLPFKCKTCNKAFNCLNLLKTHKRKVHSNMTFNCLQCGKPFKDTRNWRRHMRLICQVPMDQIPYIRDRQFIKHSYLSPN